MKVRIRVADEPLILTVEDGVAEIRYEHAARVDRDRSMEISIATDGITVPVSIAVEAIE